MYNTTLDGVVMLDALYTAFFLSADQQRKGDNGFSFDLGDVPENEHARSRSKSHQTGKRGNV
jgi:hypothetical protein